MRTSTRAAVACLFFLASSAGRSSLAEPIQLPEDPAVSPNGRQIAFAYDGDVWIAPTAGGRARQVTFDPGRDSNPQFSPDGKRLALISDRRGAAHAYVLRLDEGVPRQVTFHSEGCRIHGWYPDGRGLLVSGRRDHHWRHSERFWRVDLERPGAERPLFDAYGADGSLARDAQRLLFVREGERWWRLGYTGARSAQIWRYDLKSAAFTKMVDREGDCRWPLWRPDYRGFYFVSGDHDGFDLWSQDVDPKTKAPKGEPRKLADMGHGSIVYPALSRNGKTLVYRHLGDLYRINPTAAGAAPEKIELHRGGDAETARTVRRTLARAGEIDFSSDALEIALIAGGDVWVMDTVLREPVPVTQTPQDESDVLFGKQHNKLYLVREVDGQRDIWVAERADGGKFWWQNREFKFQRLTDDVDVQRRLKLSKDGSLLFYVQGRGELWVRNTKGDPKPRRLVSGFDAPDYDVSADGKWLAYSHSDDDFNRDVWIVPVDGSREPYNLSRHPDDDSQPRWSPDGKLLAFTGKRASDDETDIHYAWLRDSDEDVSSRDRKLQSALTKMKSRKKPPSKRSKGGIDFDGLQDRLHRVSIANVNENSLIWSADSKRLGFRGEVNSVKGIYAITIPGSSKPALVTNNDGVPIAWKSSNTLLMAVNGVPVSVDSKGAKTTYSFSAKQAYDRAARFRAALDVCWRTMRDNWYDENLGNRNWDEVRRRYGRLAEAAPNRLALRTVVELMLGELNGSHLGFYPAIAASPSSSWKEVTPHLGVRFDPDHRGPGLKIRDVIPEGPADESDSQLKPGEIILEIDGQPVDPDINLPRLINGVLERDIRLKVKNGHGELQPPLEGDEKPDEIDNDTRIVSVRPIIYGLARTRLYSKWLEDNRRHVEQRSQGELGYLHIRAMDLSSFVEFERQLYYVGYGKDGLVIDVRENGGGFTTDLLLTALTQPQHAITVPRGGGKGYPQSRMVYATWNKPIIVLCNQNSYSNAEIFSHAIKHLGRGKLVGVPTAGGVISTGSVNVLDVGRLRFPFRGWFLAGSGEDMELHGAVPDVVIWPQPGELPGGVDRQLDKAIDLLRKDVKQWRQRKQPKLRRATQR